MGPSGVLANAGSAHPKKRRKQNVKGLTILPRFFL